MSTVENFVKSLDVTYIVKSDQHSVLLHIIKNNVSVRYNIVRNFEANSFALFEKTDDGFYFIDVVIDRNLIDIIQDIKIDCKDPLKSANILISGKSVSNPSFFSTFYPIVNMPYSELKIRLFFTLRPQNFSISYTCYTLDESDRKNLIKIVELKNSAGIVFKDGMALVNPLDIVTQF